MDRVKLNVGGRLFETTLETITKYPESMLAGMIKFPPGETGIYFIDRNPDAFAAVLDFYRNNLLSRPPTVSAETFQREIDFWLPGSHQPVKGSPFTSRQMLGTLLHYLTLTGDDAVKSDFEIQLLSALMTAFTLNLDYLVIPLKVRYKERTMHDDTIYVNMEKEYIQDEIYENCKLLTTLFPNALIRAEDTLLDGDGYLAYHEDRVPDAKTWRVKENQYKDGVATVILVNFSR